MQKRYGMRHLDQKDKDDSENGRCRPRSLSNRCYRWLDWCSIYCPDSSQRDLDFPLIMRRGELLDDNTPRPRFMIIVSWRSTRSTWLPRWPVFIWSSVQALHPLES